MTYLIYHGILVEWTLGIIGIIGIIKMTNLRRKKNMQTFSIVFTISTRIPNQTITTQDHMKNICDEIADSLKKFNEKQNIEVFCIEIEGEADWISVEAEVSGIESREALNMLIDQIKDGQFDADFQEYKTWCDEKLC